MSYAFTPRQMRASTAAWYCGLSESAFLARVQAGKYPPGARDGGARVWLRDDLDAMMDRRFGMVARDGTSVDDDPFAARLGH